MSLEEIIISIDALALRGGIKREQAFAAWYAINFHDTDEDQALEAAGVDGGNDQGIDIVFYDYNNDEIVVIQSHCPSNTTKKTPKNKIDCLITSMPFIRDTQLLKSAGREDLAELIDDLKKEFPNSKYALGLLSLGKKSDDIMRTLKAHNVDPKNDDYRLFYLSQEDNIANYQALLNAEDGISEDKICFYGDIFEDQGDYGNAWIGSVSALELKRLYEKHKDRLFAGNVRLYLGARKGGINEQIIATAKNEPGNFWALNNGITIVADSAQMISKAEELNGQAILIENNNDAAKTKRDCGVRNENEVVSSITNHASSSNFEMNLRRFSIVNGCQTTSSLVKANADDKAKVLLRVIVAKTSLKNEIVRYNNSQNGVKIWTVRAVDPIQERLRNEFKNFGITYAPKQSGSRKKKDNNTIELDKLTQYLASSTASYLIQALNNKSELFDAPYNELFKQDTKSTDIYLAWLVGEKVDTSRQEMLKQLDNDENANLLGVASRFWLIFCTYKIIEKINNLSTSTIHLTVELMKSQEFQSALTKYIDKAIDLYYDAAVDTYDKIDFGSVKSALRSQRFLDKINSKLNVKIARIKGLPKLQQVIKSIPKNQ